MPVSAPQVISVRYTEHLRYKKGLNVYHSGCNFGIHNISTLLVFGCAGVLNVASTSKCWESINVIYQKECIHKLRFYSTVPQYSSCACSKTKLALANAGR